MSQKQRRQHISSYYRRLAGHETERARDWQNMIRAYTWLRWNLDAEQPDRSTN